MLLALLLAAKIGAPVIGSVVAALIAALGAYLLAARRLSGRINTSEATSLWEEAGKLRQEYKDEIAALRRQVVACEERLGITEERNRSLYKENAALVELVEKHEATIRSLRRDLSECQETTGELLTTLEARS